MTPLQEILAPRLIRIRVEAADKAALLKTLAEVLERANPVAHGVPVDKERIYGAVMGREGERSSALGHGCALPHARIDGLERPVACLATLASDMDFDAADHEPVRTVCLLLAPAEDPAATLNIMAEFAGLMSVASNREAVAGAASAEALWAWLRDLGPETERVLTARNLMRKPFYSVYPDTPLTEVTRLLQRHHLEATSVVDKDGRLVGMISCDLLFKYGLPDFFGQLKSVAFVKKFDPFENYFKGLKTAVAADVMTQDYAAMPEDATLLEVIFELCVHRHPKIFVVREGKLAGIIDRVAVLDRVLNY